ncbi:MAG: ankyrin repeat domain-containing protein [Bacteroidia bacterium]
MKKFFTIFFILLLFIGKINGQISSWQAENLVIDDDLGGIKTLIENGLDINTRFKQNRTFLHLAMEYGKTDIIKFLVEKGADLNLRDDYLHYTPLLISTSTTWRNDDYSEYLISKGADLDIADNYGNTALKNTLGFNGKKQNSRIFILLVEKGANIKPDTSDKSKTCSTLFLDCCAWGTTQMLQAMLDKKADINQTNCYGLNGLMYAINYKNNDAISFLIKNGIDLNHTDNYKQTATSYALGEKKVKIIPDGVDRYFDRKGRLISETPYKNGKKNGEFKYYYKSGKLKQSINYSDDKELGFWRDYYENGKIKFEADCDGKGNIVNNTYYEWNEKDEKFMYKGSDDGNNKSSKKIKYKKTKIN